VVVPGAQPAGGVDRAAQVVEAGRAEEAVAHVVFARPRELDWCRGAQGDGSGLDHVVVGEAATEAAAGADQVELQFVGRN